MLVLCGIILFVIWPVYTVDPSGQACNVKLPAGDHKSDIYVNNLKWKEPETAGQGDGVDFTCKTGFLNEELKEKNERFVCSQGSYNKTYKYSDLLCKSDFHKSIKVRKVPGNELKSSILQCSAPGLVVYEILREKPDGEKLLYKVCLDSNTMRTKFSFKPSSPEKPVVKPRSRNDDVWGFDGYGKTSEERMRLSQGYVKKVQQRRTTNAFSDKYNQGKMYPYYFNRGHLVAYTDFSDHEDQKGTVEYLNAAPQWDVLNEQSWSLVERESRSILQNNPADWEVYTGTYGRLPSPKGAVFLAPMFDQNGRFLKGQLPVPLVFWKLVHNTKDKTLSRAFVGVNNPEFKLISDITNLYRLCYLPVRRDGKLVQGDEYKGFTYECPVEEFLGKLNAEEKIVKAQ